MGIGFCGLNSLKNLDFRSKIMHFSEFDEPTRAYGNDQWYNIKHQFIDETETVKYRTNQKCRKNE